MPDTIPPKKPVETVASSHYDSEYFEWQRNLGAFSGWAESFKFRNSICPEDTAIDFGCGGGFLLQNLNCGRRIGIEPNPTAAESIKRFGITHFFSPTDALRSMGEEVADVIISDHALEHTLNPLQEIKNLRPLLRIGGIIHFFVPCETFHSKYNPKDINRHLFSWSPLNLGNIFEEAGYSVEFSRPHIHKWPPFYRQVAKLGWPVFNMVSKICGRIERSWHQVEVRARRISA